MIIHEFSVYAPRLLLGLQGTVTRMSAWSIATGCQEKGLKSTIDMATQKQSRDLQSNKMSSRIASRIARSRRFIIRIGAPLP